jgi:excisionase family DNA binding protein
MTKPDVLPDPRERPFLTAAEAAPLLGVSRSNVYRMIKAGQLPTIQLGGLRSTRIVTAELLRSVMGLDAPTGGQ